MDKTPIFPSEGLARKLKSGKLNILEYENRDQLGRSAATAVSELMKGIINEKGQVRMVFASAMSQTDFLKYLGEMTGIDWAGVYAFHLDEYLDFPSDHNQSFAKFLKDRLFDRKNETHFYPIRSDASDTKEECNRYSGLLNEAPIDIMILGIGESGHLAFIDPPYCDFDDPETFKTTEIDDQSRLQMVHDGCFASIDEVPKQAYTMTVPACLSGLTTIIIVPTSLKAKAVQAVVEGPVTASVPASILQKKENSWLLIDRESGSLLR
ncbi:MAG: 6-phosphogluconolactonase [Candidatus Latescibacteria bacterium]|nr:6-phosphogluconolactonase [Candidatus Latescibacterota bacterium]